MDINSLRSQWAAEFNELLPDDVLSPDCDIEEEIERCQKVIDKLKAKLRREEFFLSWLKSQRDEIEGNDFIPRTRSGNLFSGEKHEMAVATAAKLREMDKQIASFSTREPLYSTDSDDGVSCPAHVEVTYYDDSLVNMSREVVHIAIHRAVALCEYVDTILQQAIRHVQRDEKESYCEEDTLKSPQNNMTYEERYAAFRSDSSSSSISTHEHTVDIPTASAEEMHTKTEQVSPNIDHKHNLLHSDSSSSSGADTPIVENRKEFRLVKITPLVQSVSLEEDATTTPIIELNQTPTRINSFSHQFFHEEQNTEEKQNDKEQGIPEEQMNIAEKQNVEDNEEKQNIEEKEDNEEEREVEENQNIKHEEDINEQSDTVKENADEYSHTICTGNADEQASEGDDDVGELLPINGEIKINVVPTRQDDGSLSPEPSYSKLLVSSKNIKKDDTLDGKIFGSLHTHMMHQSDSLPSFTSHGKIVDPDSISLVINQCNDEDMEHSDEDILIAHSMDSTTFIDEFLDNASLDSTNFSQESRSNLVFPNSPVALRHNKESIIRRRYDAGRFDETSPVKEEEKNGLEEFAELFEQTFQLSRNQRERSSSPHSNKVASVFVFEGSHDDDNAKFSAPVRRRGIRMSKSFQVRRNTVVEEGEVLIIRKLVVAGIVAAEKSYIECLNALKEYYRKPLVAVASSSQPILNEREVNTIFFIGIEELQQLHVEIYRMLEPRVQEWSATVCVGDVFVELCKHLNLYKEYVEMYRRSLECLKRCRSENVSFEKFLEDVHKLLYKENPEIPQIQDLLRKPVDRLQSYSLVLNDLCQHTPDAHDDYQILKESLNVMSDFISSTHDPSSFRELSGGFNRELVKDGLMVELSDGIRKMRNLLLFHDILVCAKQKLSRNHVKLEYKWYLPLAQLQFHPYSGSEATTKWQPVKVTSDTELSLLKSKIAETKMQLKQEKAGSLQVDGGRRRLRHLRLTRLTKRLEEQQISLWMATPSLPLRLFGKNGKNYVFLVHTEDIRESWIMAIKKMQIKSNNITLTNLELQDLLSRQKLKHVDEISGFDSEISNEVAEKEYLTGILRAHVLSANNIKGKPGTYCCLEVDDYGKFDRKARTPVANADNDTITWDQAYELEIHGAQQLKAYICFKSFRLKEDTVARGSLSLPVAELKKGRKVKSTLKMYPQGTLQLILQYFTSSAAASEPRTVMASSGVFGVPLSTVTEREKHDIPLIVQTCVDEVERRGMDETGIYRVAGVISDIGALRKSFDTDYLQAQLLCAETDIHAVAGLLKKYFRELPEPLFTNALYPNFVDGLSLKDHEARDQCLITLLHSLPAPHFNTAVYIFEHLKRVAEHSKENKMTLGNLATVFGPNLIRPATSQGDMTLESLDVMSQVGVLHYFLTLPSEMLDSSAWKRSSPGTLRKRIRNLSDQPGSASPRPGDRGTGSLTKGNRLPRSKSSTTSISDQMQSTV